MSMLRWLSVVMMIGLLTGGLAAIGADAPATQPESQPSTQFVPHTADLPPGFHKLVVGAISVFCLPTDDAWLEPAIKKVKPASRPTTMPSDLLASFSAHRGELVKQLAAELALTDEKPLNTFLDDKYVPVLNKVAALKFNVYFFPVTRKQLGAIMKAGWHDPRYYFNRLATDVDYTLDINISIDHPMSDMVMWIELKDDATDADKANTVKAFIEDYQTQYLLTVSVLGQMSLGNALDELIVEQAIKPMKLPETIAWVGDGLAAEISVKNLAWLTGMDRTMEIERSLKDNRRNPLASQGLDLMNPYDPTTLRPEYAALYKDAAIHKGARAIHEMVKQAGDDALTKVLVALRNNPPANVEALVKLIKSTTGVDLTPQLKPNYAPTAQ